MLHRDIKRREVFICESQEFLEKYFSYKRCQVLNYIDTLYYTITSTDDTCKCNETVWYRYLVDELKAFASYDDAQFHDTKLFVGQTSVPHFQLQLYYPDCFDVYVAEFTHTNDTPFIQVQLRSSYLWLTGVEKSIAESRNIVFDMLEKCGCNMDSLFVKENRIDYCYHTNYIESPSKFFTPEKIACTKLSRLKESFAHINYFDDIGFDIDYYTFGQRSSPVFLRFYLKTKECVEKGKVNKKCFFINVWLQREMISEYDAFCLTYAYERSSWHELQCGRLEFVLQYCKNLKIYYDDICVLLNASNKDYDAIRHLADKLVPDVHSIINCEFQCNRKFFSSCVLFDLSDDRLNNVFKNTDIICDYLTHKTFRFVDYYAGCSTRKDRCDSTKFWRLIQDCKFCERLDDIDYTLVRDYTRKTNFHMMKRRAITAINSLSLCVAGDTSNDLITDVELVASIFNDNDIEEARTNKMKRASRVSYLEEYKSVIEDIRFLKKFIELDANTGEIN